MNQYKFDGGFNVKLFVIIISVILLVSYGIFNARDMLMGPTIEMFNPIADIETNDNMLIVKGRVKNISFVTLNGKSIYVDRDGLFEEKLLLVPGSNIIEVKAKDRFKKEALEIVKVYYNQNEATTTIKISNIIKNS